MTPELVFFFKRTLIITADTSVHGGKTCTAFFCFTGVVQSSVVPGISLLKAWNLPNWIEN